MTDRIGPATAADVPAVEALISVVDLFPADLVRESMTPALEGVPEGGTWLIALDERDTVTGAAWVRPEPLTERTWNLLALAVHPSTRRRGTASALVRAVTEAVALRGGSPLLVQTSSTDDYAAARALYDHLGFRQAAVIPDYYAPGDDQVVFWKQ